MSYPLVLYTHPRLRGRTVRRMPEEIARPREVRSLRHGVETKAADDPAVGPMGEVPAHGGRVGTGMAAERAGYRRWMSFAAGPTEAAATDAVPGVAIGSQRRGMIGYGSLASMLDAVEAMLLPHPCVARGGFSADAPLPRFPALGS